MLRYTGVELERLSDLDQVMFIERSIRGGVSFCANRLEEQAEDRHLAYLDVTNLVKQNLHI
jgi:hypothetical protein